MKLLAFIPIRLTLLLIAGILIGRFFSFHLTYLLYATISLFVLFATVFVFEKNTKTLLFGISAALAFITLGIFCYTVSQPINNTNHYSKLHNLESAEWTLKINEILKQNNFANRYYATVKSCDGKKISGSILITIPKDSISRLLQIDDEIVTFSKIENIDPPLNPHQFNYKKYLQDLGIYHQMQISSKEFIITQNQNTTLIGIAAKARNYIINNLKKENFGPEELSVVQALLLGQRSDISEETYSNYQKAGAVHILAVSGLHIGILLILIQFLLSPFKNIPNGNTIILILSVFFLWVFAFIAGLSASIIRATTMFTFVAYALYLNRPSNTFNILALSMLFILLFINPNLLFQVGFQMSYAAVFAILWIFPILRDLWFPKNKVVRYFWQLLCVSIAAQLGVLPISLFYFHQFPGLFFISNLIVVPALGVILGIGIFVIFLSVFNLLPVQLVWLYNKIIGVMNSLIAWVAEQEHFIFSSISFDFSQLILSFLVLFLGINLFYKFSSKRIALFLISIICFQGWAIYQEYNANKITETIVLHQSRNSILLNRYGKNLSILNSQTKNIDYLINDYKTAERIHSVLFDSLKNSYTKEKMSLLIIDSTGIYPKEKTDKILLTHSPKINLERIIDSIHPKEIIADGSNYKSYIDRWKTTCLKNKIPFHYTGEKGAYYFE
ncbi:ComEC/Rec2 family competence protein [Maribacter hydrothermalis]|uniref:Competence protein n=1 Tax=Maribacter hydrothermalis TaxID=1836467 RepID=A0A1B7YXV1_9FLAO|nr:ComEC/Rec2 family competence protein [Maribacter hydrothermalis]APQ16886.1 competence protein [Maribacter hydrothermalis]OBR35315.1 competence protein [Maribacter hydrothermalis]